MDNESIVRELIALWEREYPRQSTKTIDAFDWKIKTIQANNIKTFMPRNISKAKRYKELKQNGVEFPPIVVVRRKKDSERYTLVDGFHRMWAYKKLGVKIVEAYVGTKKEKRKNQDQPENFINKGLYNSEGM